MHSLLPSDFVHLVAKHEEVVFFSLFFCNESARSVFYFVFHLDVLSLLCNMLPI